ncbi:hypothetical protein F53441_3161 [Fusarium austroafricanum]|uniref:Uncharacterized protein n=1 Tax=Fusarium austroafricanum TaxID=2364996 RepID=A0A8H4KQ25_9HYPO|nr:hypothetical protein F53441_3161 [Fusarium austroafricanum]
MATPKGPSLPTADAPKATTTEKTPVQRSPSSPSVDITTSDLARIKEALDNRKEALASAAIRPEPIAPQKTDPLLNHPVSWQLRQHEYLVSRKKDRQRSTPETLPATDQPDESSPRLDNDNDPDKTPRPAHATIKIENPSNRHEELEIRAREELLNQQRRLHEETFAGMLEVTYWSLRAEHAAARLEKTMAEMRQFMEDLQDEKE